MYAALATKPSSPGSEVQQMKLNQAPKPCCCQPPTLAAMKKYSAWIRYQITMNTLPMMPKTIMLPWLKRAWASRSWSAVILSALGARVWSANQDTSTRLAYHTWNRMLRAMSRRRGSHHQEAWLRRSSRVFLGSRKMLTRLPNADGLESLMVFSPVRSGYARFLVREARFPYHLPSLWIETTPVSGGSGPRSHGWGKS